MSAFWLMVTNLLTDKDMIRDMWADHFEVLGTPSENDNFDSDFLTSVADTVQELLISFSNDPNGPLCETLRYEEIAFVCSRLKSGISGVQIDYERISICWTTPVKLLFQLFQNFFTNVSACDSLKTSAKANNKDNYRGVTLFTTLCKSYDMGLLNRLESYDDQKGLFSDMQFGFKKGVGCTQASFTILETINHMLGRGSKVFVCFLDVRKAFDTVWIDGFMYK